MSDKIYSVTKRNLRQISFYGSLSFFLVLFMIWQAKCRWMNELGAGKHYLCQKCADKYVFNGKLLKVGVYGILRMPQNLDVKCEICGRK